MLEVFLRCPPFQNGWKMLGYKTQTFHRLPFSLLLASNCFPHCFFCFLLLALFVGWENVPQQVPNTRSSRTYVTFRGKVVCRKCYSEKGVCYIFWGHLVEVKSLIYYLVGAFLLLSRGVASFWCQVCFRSSAAVNLHFSCPNSASVSS